MNVRAIRSEEDYRWALREIEQLMEVARAGTEEEDRLDVLGILVEAYERKHHPVPAPDPISAIKYYMESRGVRRRDLERMLNVSSGRISEILNGKRHLTKGMIWKLHKQLGISLEALFTEYLADDDETNDSLAALPGIPAPA
jgi:HTH-type transcriptional regulator/antitoxin HigA